MAQGIYFTKIAALGLNKKNAELEFSKGLNVLTGASNTGKSYVLECFNYILGGGSPLRPIQEAIGYNKIRVEIRTFEGKIFTLERMFAKDYADNYITLVDGSFDEFELNSQKASRVLSTRHSEKNEQNISAFLLKLLNLTDKNLTVSEQYHQTRSLSFRDLARFCLVDETRMINQTSPIYYDKLTDQTVNKSLFKLLLTGEDDDNSSQIERPEITKSRLKGMLEIVNSEIQRKENLLTVLKKRCESVSNEEVTAQIEKLVNIVQNAYKQLEAEEQQRELIGNQISQLKSSLSHDGALLMNFEVLRKHYESDLNRLQFINEGKQGLDQLEMVNCPLCNNLINKKILEPYIEDAPEIVESVKQEYAKTQSKEVGLAKSISELNIKITEYKSELEGKSKEFQQVDSLIANRLKPVHELHHENLAKFLRLKEDMGQVSILEFEISEHKKKSEDLNAKLKEKVITLPPKVIPENVYTELSDEIKRILVSWGIDCKDLYYDDKDCDIVINGDKRVNSGKGYRGLYLSAFMIGALLFSLKKNRPHPNFLVLDSPLTAFMEKDKSRVSESDDAIPMEIQDKFYESLATLPQRNNLQIIIIENKEPNATILEKIKHEHFTKNEEIGRYGFYP